MRMFVGIYVFVVQMRWIAVIRIRIYRIMRIYRIGTMLCIVGWKLTWMSMDRYGLGVFVLDDRCGWYKGLDSSLCSE